MLPRGGGLGKQVDQPAEKHTLQTVEGLLLSSKLLTGKAANCRDPDPAGRQSCGSTDEEQDKTLF